MAKKKFELTSPVWQNAAEQIPAGTVVTFDDNEPAGIFIGRVRELNSAGEALEVASPAKAETAKELNAQTGEAAPVPAPPAAKK